MQPGWPKAPVELNTLFGSTLRKIQAQNGGSERRPKSMQEASLPSQPRYHPKSHGSFPVSWSLAVSSMKPIYGALTGCQHWQDCFVQVSERLMSSYHVEDFIWDEGSMPTRSLHTPLPGYSPGFHSFINVHSRNVWFTRQGTRSEARSLYLGSAIYPLYNLSKSLNHSTSVFSCARRYLTY